MKITGFSGSPRKDGSTNTLVKRILKNAEENDYETAFFSLNNLDINPCQACSYCAEENGCDLDDDMNDILNEIKSSEYVVIGSPVYFGQSSAQTRLFTDRFYSIYNNKSENFKGKKAILVYTQGDSNPELYEQYFNHEKEHFYEFVGFDVVNTLIAPGVHSKEELLKNEELLNEADNILMEI